jgi:two-component system response regulator GlrR
MTGESGRRNRILLVDDDPGLLRLLTLRLKSEGYEVAACENAAQAQASLPRFKPDVVVTDLRMADLDGIGLLKILQRRYPALPVLLMTAHGTIPDAVSATRSGAFAFLTKPVERQELLEKLRNAISTSGFAWADGSLRSDIPTRSPLVEDCLLQAESAALSSAPLLITGKPGTGKARLARAIHRSSEFASGPFTRLDCSTLHHAAFAEAVSGAPHRRPPRVTNGAVGPGTLYLEEVGSLESQAQLALMEALSPRHNGSSDEPKRPRIIASTSQDLRIAGGSTEFRQDLYFALSVNHIEMPSLAQRREDIPLLAARFLDEWAKRAADHRVLAPEALELLTQAEWPGNIPQLRNALERAASTVAGQVISAEAIQQLLGVTGTRLPTFDEARDEFTRSYLVQLLQISDGNVSRAARLAGRNRTDFYKLLSKHSISTRSFKPRT